MRRARGAVVTIPQHSSATQEHYTPAHVVEAARRVLGAIDLDPASCLEAQQTVRADSFFTAGVNGLFQPWRGRVFLNPPGGSFTPKNPKGTPAAERRTITAPDKIAKERWQTDSRAVAWWRKLVHDCALPAPDDVTAAIFVGFTLEILSNAQHPDFLSPLDFPICVPSERLRFGGDQPTHANVIVYTGSDVERFAAEFSPIGAVKV
jgi:hypothetical protein